MPQNRPRVTRKWSKSDLIRELKRIRNSRTYYNETYLRIRTKGLSGAPKLVPLKYNETQKRLDAVVARQEREGRPVRVIIVKARQEGVSTYVESYIFKKTVLNKYVKSIVVAHDTESAIGLFAMAQLFYDSLPPQLRPMKRFSNRRELLFENPDDRKRPANPGLRSHMYIGTAANLDLGRSATIQNAHLSEFAFWPDAEVTMLSLTQAIPEAPGTSIFIESTANGKGNYFHNLYRSAKAGENDYEAVFFPWFIFKEYRRPGPKLDKLSKYEMWLKEECGCNDDQLRWRRWAIINKCGGDVDKFKQEYPATDEEAFISSGKPVFDQKIVSALIRTAPDPKGIGEVRHDSRGIYIFIRNPNGHFRQWKEPERDKTYVIGADVAEGVQDGNYSCAEILCREDFEQVAEWHGHIEPDQFGHILADLGNYYNRAMVACESNGPGVATLAALRELYWYLYSTVKMDQLTRTQSKKIGWTTTMRTRPLLIEGIAKALREGEIIINSKELLEEMTWFVYEEPKNSTTGILRPQAPRGKYDDRIFALGIAIQAHLQHPVQDIGKLKSEAKQLAEMRELDLPSRNMVDREKKKMLMLQDPYYREVMSGRYDEHLGIFE